jgi:erythromycin esterase-like protein
MQYGGVAIQNVRNFVTAADPAYLPTLNAAYALALAITNNLGASQPRAAVQAATDAVQAVRQYLAGHRADYLANNGAAQVDWAIQNAVIVEQSTYYAIGGSTYRDACMAANIDWIVQQNPGARVVLWAHDFHISRADGAMGSYLAANHGKDYVTIGQIFHSGQYNAYNNNGKLVANDAVTSSPPMVEYVLHSAGMPRFVLDLRRASPSDPGSSWLFGTTLYRVIGAVADIGLIYSNQLTTDYDILVFFDQVTASALLPPV